MFGIYSLGSEIAFFGKDNIDLVHTMERYAEAIADVKDDYRTYMDGVEKYSDEWIDLRNDLWVALNKITKIYMEIILNSYTKK